MRAWWTVVRSGVRRRRIAFVTVGLSTAAAVSAAVLGGGLMVASDGPFDRAFAAQRGAHLTVEVDPGRAAAAQVARTGQVTGVTAVAGPFATVAATPYGGPGTGWMEGKEMSALRIAGRATPVAAVDRVAVVTGRWVTGPGEIVLAADPPPPPLGSTVVFPDRPGRPALTVVGTARSAGHSADAWVAPDQVAALTTPGSPVGWQLLYRLGQARTEAEVEAARAAIVAALPPESVRGAQSWLVVRATVTGGATLYVPFLLVFALLSLMLSGFVAANTIAGAVSADRRRIGVLKAVGCGPGQILMMYLAQVLIPASAGAVLGLVAGELLAVPILAETADVYGVAGPGLPPGVAAAATAAVLALVAAVAGAAAGRAARLAAVEVLATGPARPIGKARSVSIWPLPAPVALGLARTMSRPGRAAAVFAAVVFGATTVTLAAGLTASLGRLQEARPRGGDVLVTVPPAAGPDQDAVTRAIDAQPGTGARYGVAVTQAVLAGRPGAIIVSAVTGDASGAYRLTVGRWFERPGEAVVATAFLTAAGLRVGDSATVDVHGTAIAVRLVGEVFDTSNGGLNLMTDLATVAVAEALPEHREYHITLLFGSDPSGYADRLNHSLAGTGATAEPIPDRTSGSLLTAIALTTALGAVLAAVAALGVLNVVLLEVRARARDIGIQKAIGMTPVQTVAAIVASVLGPGLLGAVAGVVAGRTLHGLLVPAMGRSAGFTLPAGVTAALPPSVLVLLAGAGVLIAVAGALPPAVWAARVRTVGALRAD
ncbi:FtsX-like permease family protein [Dactylosporangium sp. NPDC051541]|uniref:ABC transporter permease n=1 Tax=Dactylosporangium sp. NPDC051541 TaxID=3363977 RepID=UPI0037ABE0B3